MLHKLPELKDEKKESQPAPFPFPAELFKENNFSIAHYKLACLALPDGLSEGCDALVTLIDKLDTFENLKQDWDAVVNCCPDHAQRLGEGLRFVREFKPVYQQCRALMLANPEHAQKISCAVTLDFLHDKHYLSLLFEHLAYADTLAKAIYTLRALYSKRLIPESLLKLLINNLDHAYPLSIGLAALLPLSDSFGSIQLDQLIGKNRPQSMIEQCMQWVISHPEAADSLGIGFAHLIYSHSLLHGEAGQKRLNLLKSYPHVADKIGYSLRVFEWCNLLGTHEAIFLSLLEKNPEHVEKLSAAISTISGGGYVVVNNGIFQFKPVNPTSLSFIFSYPEYADKLALGLKSLIWDLDMCNQSNLLEHYKKCLHDHPAHADKLADGIGYLLRFYRFSSIPHHKKEEFETILQKNPEHADQLATGFITFLEQPTLFKDEAEEEIYHQWLLENQADAQRLAKWLVLTHQVAYQDRDSRYEAFLKYRRFIDQIERCYEYLPRNLDSFQQMMSAIQKRERREKAVAALSLSKLSHTRQSFIPDRLSAYILTFFGSNYPKAQSDAAKLFAEAKNIRSKASHGNNTKCKRS